MLRILLGAAAATLALAPSSQAAVVPSVASDTLTISGDAAADQITLRLAPGNPGRLQVDAGGSVLAFDRASFSRIAIRSGAGADTVRMDESEGAFTDTEATTIETGAGADAVSGGRGAETIATGDDGDLVQSGAGADRVLLGLGDDTFVQGPEDGSDELEGQTGTDTVRIDGSAEAEELTVQAVDGRVRASRDTGDARMDMEGVEVARIDAAGGSDLVDLGDLAGTALDRVDADAGVADGAPDTVAAQGTAGRDLLSASALGEGVQVRGLPFELRVESTRRPEDRLRIDAGAGDDRLQASAPAAGRVAVELDGGAGADVLSGSADEVRGGADADTVLVGTGPGLVDLGDGDDVASWNPGAGNRTVDGGGGEDQVTAGGFSADDAFEVGPAGSRVQVTRGSERLDLDGLETVKVSSGGGTDRILTRDLAGTATRTLAVAPGGSDLKSDTVTITGTPAADAIRATSVDTSHTVAGQGATVLVERTEPGDRLEVNGGDGDDTIDATGMAKDKLQPVLDGGAGSDTLVGSPGQDAVTGGTGKDFAFLRDGLDTFNWAAEDGDDIVEGGAGTDFLHLDGSAAAERFDVTGLGSRTRVTRDVSGEVIDLGQVERLDLMPGRGRDFMHVGDLSGTDVAHVAWELAPARTTNSSDGEPDQVLVDGTFGNDAVSVTAGGPQVRMTGLAAEVITNRSDPGLDTMHVDTKPGADIVSVDPRVRDLIGFSSN